MSAKPRPFQVATARQACAVLCSSSGARRFLVADEPGLGKTMVAREIISSFVASRRKQEPRRTVVVYYIANGLRVAHQNRDRLVAATPKPAGQKLVSSVERLSLIPMAAQLQGSVELFTLTPTTSFPGVDTAATVGRADERAFLLLILEQAMPKVAQTLHDKLLRRGASEKNWSAAKLRMRQPVEALQRRFFPLFRRAMCEEFTDELTDFGKLVERAAPRTVLTRLRRALSHAALLYRPPDLVIMDEFQKYRRMITPEGRVDRLVDALYANESEHRPAVLLLSGTPYPSTGVGAHLQLFELLAFLKGNAGFSKKLGQDFEEFRDLLLDISQAAKDPVRQSGLARRARLLRDCIERAMTQVMARTERTVDQASTLIDQQPSLEASLVASDMKAFAGLVSIFNDKDRSDAMSYWLSVPLASQALGPRYQAWKNRKKGIGLIGPTLTASSVSRLQQPAAWPHPKLRAMHRIAPPTSLALPWIAPTLPWWKLRGEWNRRPPEKLLVFSRFKATPQSIAALTSYSVDATALHSKTARYEHAIKARRLRANKAQMPLFALFHPSPFLAEHTDPIAGGISESLPQVRKKLRAQLRRVLGRAGVELPDDKNRKRRASHRPVWKIVAAIERRFQYATAVKKAWDGHAKRDTAVAAMLSTWQAVAPISSLSALELDDLVEMALAAPGVICARAIRRHHPETLAQPHLAHLVELTWSGMRGYLDEPVFFASWAKGKVVEAIHTIMTDGCFESVLDEHLWMRVGAVEGGAAMLAQDLAGSLKLSGGSFTYHVLSSRNGAKSEDGIRIRCHAAVPFDGTDDESAARRGAKARNGDMLDRPPGRADELRAAFNTPFWPHVLASTSVGQEGLDFHTWCSRVAHWDLCPTPVELEQREGRINRYAGLAVRRVLAAQLRDSVVTIKDSMSPWACLARLADERCGDQSGLQPWWQVDGARTTRIVFRLPLGRDQQRFAQLQKERLLYRLALGQANPEDLVQALATTDSATLQILQSLGLNLSAFRQGLFDGANEPEAA